MSRHVEWSYYVVSVCSHVSSMSQCHASGLCNTFHFLYFPSRWLICFHLRVQLGISHSSTVRHTQGPLHKLITRSTVYLLWLLGTLCDRTTATGNLSLSITNLGFSKQVRVLMLNIWRDLCPYRVSSFGGISSSSPNLKDVVNLVSGQTTQWPTQLLFRTAGVPLPSPLGACALVKTQEPP